jgi:spore coat polysaccharide biosynthesis predicted glycosyltransferase SpsG
LFFVNRKNSLSNDKITLDPVINDATNKMEKITGKKYDIVVTIQPTSPLLKSTTLEKALNSFIYSDFDTLISGINNPHLSWTLTGNKYTPNYSSRVNRQYLPKHIIETGAFLITKRKFVSRNNRIGDKVSIFELSEKEAIDIDNFSDWWITEKYLRQKNILIRTEGFNEIGMGHVYRSLILISGLIEHNVKIVFSNKSNLAEQKLKETFFPYQSFSNDEELLHIAKSFNTDIFINDFLNTTEEYISLLKKNNFRVVNFEDLGPGSFLADAVINDLYEKQHDSKNFFWGSNYFLIRDEFKLTKEYRFNFVVKNILVAFGGTDPSDLTIKLLKVILKLNIQHIKFTFVLGLGYKKTEDLLNLSSNNSNITILQNINNISKIMANSDIAIASQGRTMLELAALGIPTILLAQNKRELDHEFGYIHNGFVNLGYGNDVNSETLMQTLLWLINSPQVRLQMHNEMLKKDLKNGLEKVMNIIFGGNYD